MRDGKYILSLRVLPPASRCHGGGVAHRVGSGSYRVTVTVSSDGSEDGGCRTEEG